MAGEESVADSVIACDSIKVISSKPCDENEEISVKPSASKEEISAVASDSSQKIDISVCWHGKSYEIVITTDQTVLDLKEIVQEQTNVRVPNQKLLNLNLKGKYAIINA